MEIQSSSPPSHPVFAMVVEHVNGLSHSPLMAAGYCRRYIDDLESPSLQDKVFATGATAFDLAQFVVWLECRASELEGGQ